MDTARFTLRRDTPDAAEFAALRAAVGWGRVETAVAQRALDCGLCCVTVREGETLVGVGRVVGDGALYFYIQDLAVAPAYQGLGIGAEILQEIERFLRTDAPAGATVGLLAARGKEAFYARAGYVERTGEPLGKGMCKFV
ncbi:MAG: GNAT family N-acetyltransferase [Pseudomonadota bacterium]